MWRWIGLQGFDGTSFVPHQARVTDDGELLVRLGTTGGGGGVGDLVTIASIGSGVVMPVQIVGSALGHEQPVSVMNDMPIPVTSHDADPMSVLVTEMPDLHAPPGGLPVTFSGSPAVSIPGTVTVAPSGGSMPVTVTEPLDVTVNTTGGPVSVTAVITGTPAVSVSGTVAVTGTVGISAGGGPLPVTLDEPVDVTVNTAGGPVPVTATIAGTPAVSISGTVPVSGTVTANVPEPLQVEAPSDAPLYVTTSGALPVSASGTFPVTGTVGISGTPAVSVSGTVQANIASVTGGTLPVSGSVAITGTPAVTVSGATTVTGSVGITGTPTVAISGTVPVSISSGIANPLPVSGSVSITGTPAVTATITGTPSINATIVPPVVTPISGSRNTDGTILTIPANQYFEGYLSIASGGLTGGSTISLTGGGTGATGASGTILLASLPNTFPCTPVIRVYAGNASATLTFAQGGLSGARGTAVGCLRS